MTSRRSKNKHPKATNARGRGKWDDLLTYFEPQKVYNSRQFGTLLNPKP